MKIELEVQSRLTEIAPEIVALTARYALRGMVLASRAALRLGEVPPLYQSGVRFRREPPGVETFRDAVTTYRAGHGDCAHLVAWRVAELREAGEPATIRIYWKPTPSGRLFHVQVRRADGRIEDPSRKLGMGRNES